jgi:hypothetical protein
MVTLYALVVTEQEFAVVSVTFTHPEGPVPQFTVTALLAEPAVIVPPLITQE